MLATASSHPPTTTNRVVDEWALHDDVVRLRLWGTQQVFALYPDHDGPLTIGTASTCSIQVPDETRRVSRVHALLQFVQGRWNVTDRSRNGLFRDGAKTDKFVLTPGVEIGLGGREILVAESPKLIVLRNTLARWIGWGPRQAEAVDLALRAVRLAAQRTSTLVLCGKDVLPLAEELHRLTLTAEKPFVLVHPRRASDTAWKPTRCAPSGLAALADAPQGTVCVDTALPPSDLLELLAAIRAPKCEAQLVVCTERERPAAMFNAQPVLVPRLKERSKEVDRIILENEIAAASYFSLRESWLRPEERTWLRKMDTVADIERSVPRVAAIERAGSVSGGAAQLGISHNTLGAWLQRAKYPLEKVRRSTRATD